MAIVVLMVSQAQAQPGEMYWTALDGRGERAALDGSDRETLLTGFPFQLTGGIALDAIGSKMYWTSNNGIRRADLDGDNEEFLTSTLARRITLDVAGGKMYVTVAQRIDRANLDGTDFETLWFSSTPLQDIALDAAGGKMYWTGESTIERINLDGTNQEVLVAGLLEPWSIAVDVANGKIYWTNRDTLQRANLDGSDFETVLVLGTDTREIALNPVDGRMYWTERSENRIQRANLDGSDIESVIVRDLDRPADISLNPGTCALELDLSYADSTLDMDVRLGTLEATTWNVWVSGQNFTIPLWSTPLPPVPPVAFPIPIPGFPQIGTVGFLTTLTTPQKGVICSVWETVDTGAPAVVPSARELKQLFQGHVP